MKQTSQTNVPGFSLLYRTHIKFLFIIYLFINSFRIKARQIYNVYILAEQKLYFLFFIFIIFMFSLAEYYMHVGTKAISSDFLSIIIVLLIFTGKYFPTLLWIHCGTWNWKNTRKYLQWLWFLENKSFNFLVFLIKSNSLIMSNDLKKSKAKMDKIKVH